MAVPFDLTPRVGSALFSDRNAMSHNRYILAHDPGIMAGKATLFSANDGTAVATTKGVP
jgi:hypothetical protein